MAAGGIVVIVGTLLPWLRSGGRRRHSYDLLELVERIGFAPDGPAATALAWWPLVPLLVVSAVVAAWWGFARVGGGIGAVAAFYAGGTAVAVMRARTASSSGIVEVLAGTVVTTVGTVILLVGSVAAIVTGLRAPVSWRRPAQP
ncbi:hypothetical protein BH18ACT2_BH18ACT2_19490 [soil metagenome]